MLAAALRTAPPLVTEADACDVGLRHFPLLIEHEIL
jgi:hypothetical protein